MKKFFAICISIIFILGNVVYANDQEIAYTQETDIKCDIDGMHIDSYAINGFMYLPLDKLTYYGFEITEDDGYLRLNRKQLSYFDGSYSDSNTNREILLVYENNTPVIINNKEANTYFVDNKIVIQADELLAFGKVEWSESTNKVIISIVVDELKEAFENAENKVEYSSQDPRIIGQVRDGVLNGIVKTIYFQGMTYIGYMIDGEYEGVVYGYREHKPYLAELTEIRTVKNGKKNGYCSYSVGYNNKPQMPGETKNASGIYEDDKLKNGIYTIISDYSENTETYIVEDYIEHILSSTHNYLEYETSEAQIFYNGEKIEFDVLPIVENDRTLIPLRGLFEKMGAEVNWDGSTCTASVLKNNANHSFKINFYNADVNGDIKYMDVPARLVNDRTMIPLRFLSEELGYTVEWDQDTKTIIISD